MGAGQLRLPQHLEKRIYNFRKVSAVLADYGFNCIKLTGDSNGADFLARHMPSDDQIPVRLNPFNSRQEVGKRSASMHQEISPFGPGLTNCGSGLTPPPGPDTRSGNEGNVPCA